MKNYHHFIQIKVIVFTLLLYSCHNAKAPDEEITSTPFLQDSSVIFIPISISNAGLSQLIKSKISNPLIDSNQNISIPVFNPVTAPVLWTHKILVDGTCEVLRNVRVSWKCVFSPSACFALQTFHEACKVEKVVSEWINQTVISKVNVNLPIQYMVNLNSITFDGSSDTLAVHVVLDFKFKAEVPIAHVGLVSCGYGSDPLAQIQLTLVSKVNMANDGKLLLSDKSWGLKWNSPCSLTALDIKVEDLINLPFIKAKIESAVDNLVQNKIPNTLDIKPQLEKNWNKLSQPINLKGIGNMDLGITELSTKNLLVSKDSILTEIGAICKPVINLTDDQPQVVKMTFPRLTVEKGNDSFNINILAAATFKSLNKYASQAVSNTKDKIQNKDIEINEIKLYQHSDSLVVQVALLKPFRGKIYLWGVPKFDLTKNTISIQNLQYTTESKQLLVNLANWLLQIPIIQEKISEKFNFKYEKNVAAALDSVKNLNYALTPNINLNVRGTSITPINIIVSDNKLNVVANIKGQAFITMK